MDERATARMNTELLKKPLHAKSWSSLTRLFISDLASSREHLGHCGFAAAALLHQAALRLFAPAPVCNAEAVS